VSDHSRSTATIRWSRTVTRALHIPAVALVIGAWWLEQPALALGWPLSLAVATGVLIGFLFFFQSKAWLLEVRGAVVIAKVGLLALLPFLSATAGVWLPTCRDATGTCASIAGFDARDPINSRCSGL
jgi:hypothetical protein